ncbi:MAG TPA: malonic semialdehyde reductase [Rhizobiales bacterium]|nr:putative malonic semialdehyde reductase RutE [bacterium BMS3Bbin10]HDO52028.1 malonic semialdehyde reductase [Hyphomicrobiales bacterium]
MRKRIPESALDRIFLEARSHNAWADKDLPEALLKELVDITKMGPTSANCCPARFVFVKSGAAKARLEPHVAEGNRAKVMAAPVCTIIAHDLRFHDHLPRLFPHEDARSWFAGNDDLIETTAFRNGTLQGAYFMIAARSLGIDVGAMSGFDNAGVDAEFFPEGHIKSNFLCNLGTGDPAGLFGRSPRFEFDEMAKIL